MKQLLAPFLPLAILLSSATLSYAQDVENIYQIEVVIFERTLRTQGDDDSEYWPKSIALSYPENYVQLIDPKKETQQQAEEHSSRDEKFALSPGLLSSINDQKTNASDDTKPTQAERSEEKTKAVNGVELNTFLDRKFHSLSEKKAALNRQNGYRVLFHQTWLQHLQSPENAPALIITGGNVYGDHSELEGYISLSLSRYLHFQGHLWLTEFVANYGQPLEHWPDLPTPGDSKHTQQQQLNDWKALNAAEQTYPSALLKDDDQPRYNQWDSGEEDPYTEMQEAPYLIKNIAVLEQKRRMRSGDLHYIDHPKMGILIKIESRTADQIKTLSDHPTEQ